MGSQDAQIAPIVTWDIPTSDGIPMRLELRPGETVTIVGANGSGKSALATWIAANTPGRAFRRVLAQRRLWLNYSGPRINAADRDQFANNMASWDRSADSRYFDHGEGQRTDVALFDLIGRIQSEHQRVADLVYGQDISSSAVKEIVGPRLVDTLNSVLTRAGLFVTVDLTDKQSFTAIHKSLGASYPITQMSDGERSALLLAAEVLTAPESAIVLLDEPERHLHRSISARLIAGLIDSRDDCAFVALTHDLDLAADMSARPGKVITTLGVRWNNDSAQSWNLKELDPNEPLPEIARRAILGGRKQILFVEGADGSLDRELYGMLFPDWTIEPAGGCESVIRNVKGLSRSVAYHWITAGGVVDGDGRSEEERASLRNNQIHVLKVNEIENLYYLPIVLRAVAEKQAAAQALDIDQLYTAATTKALDVLCDPVTLDRLAETVGRSEISRMLLGRVPSTVGDEPVVISFATPIPTIRERLLSFTKDRDYEGLVRALPIRDSGLRQEVAKVLGFQSFEQYQRVARVCISMSIELASELRREIADLADDESRTDQLLSD